MKTVTIAILIIFSFLINVNLYAQTIKIHYYVGCDCISTIKGREIRGGCQTNENMEYVYKKNGKYFSSKKLKRKKEIWENLDGKFGKNLAPDSLSF